MDLSIIIPAKNEEKSLAFLLPELRRLFPSAEIIVVNDGSSDRTPEVCENHQIKMISHPYSLGNGAAIKSGARIATGDIWITMDADGQHQPKDIERLLKKLDEGYDMVIGARDKSSQANMLRCFGNGVYNRVATWLVEKPVKDLTSGFRAVRAEKFKEFLYLLPNGFSYPTTITMAFFRAGYSIYYEPIIALKREGKSHINLVNDGIKFMLIIFKMTTLYSPLRMFMPVSSFFFITACCYYLYTFLVSERFTNMGVLLFITAILVFLMGLISEQITVLMYQSRKQRF